MIQENETLILVIVLMVKHVTICFGTWLTPHMKRNIETFWTGNDEYFYTVKKCNIYRKKIKDKVDRNIKTKLYSKK